ncbi:MAG: hypothetical protein JEY91_16590 [Spirochaetaceae bacterium]|nr:hypothetical protein [Spirochaetaceae bacterium]
MTKETQRNNTVGFQKIYECPVCGDNSILGDVIKEISFKCEECGIELNQELFKPQAILFQYSD